MDTWDQMEPPRQFNKKEGRYSIAIRDLIRVIIDIFLNIHDWSLLNRRITLFLFFNKSQNACLYLYVCLS